MSEIWSDEFTCPVCGEDLEEWDEHIYECKGCENMFDVEKIEIEEREEEVNLNNDSLVLHLESMIDKIKNDTHTYVGHSDVTMSRYDALGKEVYRIQIDFQKKKEDK